ncbi:MAG: hypothetical protein GIX03_07645 [Candidatus Eremiobacteraeota bacterium]|nr:hypothetical protein [Candidatus Eremiobacteraeota bacterium]
MHLTVKSVEIGSDSGHCDFLFKENAYIGLSIKYSTQDGPREVTSLREASKGVTAIAGSIAKTIGAPAVPGVTTEATLPPGVAKVGDDQVFSTPGMTTIFAASKGDAYVEVMGGVMADGVSRWVALPEIARRVLASR